MNNLDWYTNNTYSATYNSDTDILRVKNDATGVEEEIDGADQLCNFLGVPFSYSTSDEIFMPIFNEDAYDDEPESDAQKVYNWVTGNGYAYVPFT